MGNFFSDNRDLVFTLENLALTDVVGMIEKNYQFAKEYENAIFVSVHINKFEQSKYKGLQVWYSPNDPASALYALGVQEKIRTHLQPENTRRVKRADGGIYLMEHVTSPALLIECGFLSNPEEAASLCDPAYRQQLALLIALSLVECTENAP